MFGFVKSKQFKESEWYLEQKFGVKVNELFPSNKQVQKDFDRICKESNLTLQSRNALCSFLFSIKAKIRGIRYVQI